MNGRRMRDLTAVVAAAAIGFGATAADAGKPVKTKVKLQQLTAKKAVGKVRSDEAKCKKRRKVTLHFVGEYTPVRVGKGKTKRNGKFKIKVRGEQLEPGFYYVRAPKMRAGKTTCATAESKTMRLR